MYPSQHLIYGAIFSAILLFLFPQIGWLGFLLIIASTVLIDIDHYLYYVYYKKDISLPNAYKWFIKKTKHFFSLSREQRNKSKILLFIFHGLEILILLFILSLFFKPVLFVFIGYAFHLLLDLVNQPRYWDKLMKVSIIYDFINFNNQ